MEKVNRDGYYMGFDVETKAVGWAVTDKQYNLLRAKGRDLWGTRLFPPAETSEVRRGLRCSRRRIQREKRRLEILDDLFSDEIMKIDPGFFQRLKDSFLFEEDKTVKQPYALFADKGYTDRDYYRDFPTVYHLRQAFLHGQVPKDVRLLYLAVHSLFKNRGNFYYANVSAGSSDGFESLYREAREGSINITEGSQALPELSQKDAKKVQDLLSSKKLTASSKEKHVRAILGVQKGDKQKIQWVKLICGMKGDIRTAFPHENNEGYGDEKFSLSFEDGTLEESLQKAEDTLSEDEFQMLLSLKKIYDDSLLTNIMDGEKYISDARVKSYEKHHADLEKLKAVYKKYCPEKYNDMFRVLVKKQDNYSSYVGSVSRRKVTIRRKYSCGQEELYSSIKKDLSPFKTMPDVSRIYSEMETWQFLPKQRTKANQVVPNQVYQAELKEILRRAESTFPFLAKKDETGYSTTEKILMTFKFHIPYYVGPLYNDDEHTAWSVRKEDGKVYPWNFDDRIDIRKSAEKFIENLVGTCTYLHDKKVLPKQSILYQKFCCLNELNNLRINGEKPDPKEKKKMFESLFLGGRKVTEAAVKKYILKDGLVKNECSPDDILLTGIDGGFNNTMSSYALFCKIFGVKRLDKSQLDIAESIIQWATVYGDSKEFLKARIRETYSPDAISDAQIEKAAGARFSDWGKLSKEFLLLHGADKETGEVLSIIDRLMEGNENLMQILTNDYTYMDEIESLSSRRNTNIMNVTSSDLDGLYLSNPSKRMLWQAILVYRDVVKAMGYAPERIFVELPRENKEKNAPGRKKSRIAALYKKIQDPGHDWERELGKWSEEDFSSKRVCLWFSQMGRSIYTGNWIPPEKIMSPEYDIDHIYPKHFVTDNSLDDNLVLVERSINGKMKQDKYPLDETIRKAPAVTGLWRQLLRYGLINKTKYGRLVRSTPFTDEERAAFISREVIDSSASARTIVSLLDELVPKGTKVIHAKAGNVSGFRNENQFYKVREVNNIHFAQDAYLTVPVGNVYYTRFTENPSNFIKEWRGDSSKTPYTLGGLFKHTVSRNGVVAWDVENDASLETIKTVMQKQTAHVTCMNYVVTGAISKMNPIMAEVAGKAEAGRYIPLKASGPRANISKYGGYGSPAGAYMILVEHDLKGTRVRTIETVPVLYAEKIWDREDLLRFCREKLGLVNPDIRIPKIKMYSKIKVDGFEMYLSGRTGNSLTCVNAVEQILSPDQLHYVKKIQKVLVGKWTEEQIQADTDRIKEKSQYKEAYITKEQNTRLYDTLLEKHLNGIYSKRPSAIGKKLQNGKDAFEALPTDRQVYVIWEILKTTAKAGVGDLSEIGGKKNTGNLRINKLIDKYKQICLIDESPAGLKRRVVDLKTI